MQRGKSEMAHSPYSQTLENRSSAPPNPPAGLEGALVVVVVVVVVDEMGAALAHPPKSSSAATVGAGLEPADKAGAPQPAPISLAVRVSGTFIIEAEAAGAAGAGSGVLHALPPQGSMVLGGSTLATEEVVLATDGFGAGAGAGAGVRLKADFNSCCGEVDVNADGGETAAGGAGAGEESPNKSSDKGDLGGLGFGGGGDAKLVKPASRPFDEIDAVRDCGFGGGTVGEVRLSNRLPPPLPTEAVGEDTLGAAGVDFMLAKLVKLAKGEGFSAGLGAGGEADEGMLSPLKASVKPPMLEADEPGAGDARSPNEDVRSCCVVAGGGFEYSERIDCFRSGLDIPVEPVGVEAVLAGRLVGAG